VSRMAWELALLVQVGWACAASADGISARLYPFIWLPRHVMTSFEYSVLYALETGISILIGGYAMDRLRYEENPRAGRPNQAPAVVFLRRAVEAMDAGQLRIGAICHGLWLFCAAPKGFKLAEINAKGAREIGILEKMLRKTIEQRKPGLVMLDPFIKLHALEENDNGAMDFVCDLLVQLAIQFDIAVDAPHHTKKGQLTAGDADSGRGASAARDAGRLIYTLTRMSEDEANAFGVKPEDRPLYVRLDSGKVNTAPPSRKAMWFKLVGVPLGNGNDDYPSGDEVQTLVPWQPPETWAGLSSAVLNTALTDIEAGMPNGQRYSDAARTSTRAAWQVVQRHCPDRTEAQCREIIKTWVKNGVLYHEDYDDPVERKERKGLRLDPSKRPS